MPIYEVPTSTSGIDNILVDTVNAVPSFTPLLLLFIFLVILIGGATKQKRRIGTADIPMWMTLASVCTLMIALPLTLTTGLISLTTLVIVVTITITSGIWFFLDRNRNEI